MTRDHLLFAIMCAIWGLTWIAIRTGVGGLVLLFVPKLAGGGGETPVPGLVAIVVGTLAYCRGSILSRPLLRELNPLALSAQHNLIGGTGLLALSLGLEPVGPGTLGSALRPEVVASWLFLVLAGSVAAFTIYLQLLRDWGPSRAGAYAFVSPVVALAVGAAVFGERPGPWELVGGVVLLASAALATGGAGAAAAPPAAGID